MGEGINGSGERDRVRGRVKGSGVRAKGSGGRVKVVGEGLKGRGERDRVGGRVVG